MAGMKLDCLRTLGLAAIVSLFTVSARADDVDHMTVLGHQLAIKDDPAGKALYVDGKNVMADFMIGIDGTASDRRRPASGSSERRKRRQRM
jgi:hypothetical protein